jgi:hypothetical protein
MTQINRQKAFDKPFTVNPVGGEIVAKSEQAPVELALTPVSARETGRRLLTAADEAEAGTGKAQRKPRATPLVPEGLPKSERIDRENDLA